MTNEFHSIDLNCDLGEGGQHDDAIMPLISSANIALEKAKSDLSLAEEKALQIKADSLKRSEAIKLESEKRAIEEMARIKQSAISDESSEASRAISQLRKEAVELAIKKALDSLPNKLDQLTQENLVTKSINDIEIE